MGTTYDEVTRFSNGDVAYRNCSECGAVDRSDFMGPPGHFEHCSRYYPGCREGEEPLK